MIGHDWVGLGRTGQDRTGFCGVLTDPEMTGSGIGGQSSLSGDIGPGWAGSRSVKSTNKVTIRAIPVKSISNSIGLVSYQRQDRSCSADMIRVHAVLTDVVQKYLFRVYTNAQGFVFGLFFGPVTRLMAHLVTCLVTRVVIRPQTFPVSARQQGTIGCKNA